MSRRPSISSSFLSVLADIQFLLRKTHPVLLSFSSGIAFTLLAIFLVWLVKPGVPTNQIEIHSPYPFSYVYDGSTRSPSWVMQQIAAKELCSEPGKLEIIKDSSISSMFQPNLEDYKDSGFEAAPLVMLNAYKFSRYPISACSPMAPELKKGHWEKLENRIQKLIEENSPKIFLSITGPLFLPEQGENKFIRYRVLGKSNISVPTHFFRAVFYQDLVQNKIETKKEIYIFPNEATQQEISLDSFAVSLKELENASGIDLPRNMQSYLIRVPYATFR